MFELTNKVAFVTGGSSGIGLGIVRALAAAGARVAFTYRREDHRDQAVASLAAYGDAIRAVRADVSDPKSIAVAIGETVEAFEKLHVVVNNAAVGVYAPVERCTLEDWHWLLGVNLFGVVNTLSCALPRLIAQGEGGYILNVASMAAFVAGPAYSIYATAKGGVRSLTECLRYDLAKYNIGVSLLSPGLTRTNIHESGIGHDTSIARAATDPTVMKRFADAYAQGMDPDEVGRRAVEGMQKGALYIFSHPDLRADVAAIHDQILAAFPDEEVDPARAEIEQRLRAARRAALGE